MPNRLAVRTVRPEGPTPFSSAWVRSPARPAAVRPRFVLPAWVPSERTLAGSLVLALVLVVALIAGSARAPAAGVGGGSEAALLAAFPDPSGTAAPAAAPGATATATSIAVPTEPAAPAPTATYVPAPLVGSPVAAYSSRQFDGALFPTYRILTYYGHPLDSNMGILGEYPKEELLQLLRVEAANYEAVDPTRPVVPAFEIIATVAQRDPGADGTYLLNTDPEVIQEYIDFAAANDILVFLDVQVGRRGVAAEIEQVRRFLDEPHVHLAIDPEFGVKDGETPGLHIGEVTADDVRYAQEQLVAISREFGIPPKVLIVHQFREDMIVDKPRIEPVAGVQWVLDADGFGAPELKTEVYNILVRDEQPRPEFAGIKLFYKQDEPLMTPSQVLALDPSPDLIIYQ